jgi:hypothetical protein
MQRVPWSFVPTVMVPLWLILHAIIAARPTEPSGERARLTAQSFGRRCN